MVNDSHQTPPAPKGTWGYIKWRAEQWQEVGFNSIPGDAARPFVDFVLKHRDNQIPWRDRLHILLTGKLPDAF
jgi:hypothetical protein